MEFDQLDRDETSGFAHYDEVCGCEGEVGGRGGEGGEGGEGLGWE